MLPEVSHIVEMISDYAVMRDQVWAWPSVPSRMIKKALEIRSFRVYIGAMRRVEPGAFIFVPFASLA